MNELKPSFSSIARVFDENSSSYKFYWFWAILRWLREYSDERHSEPIVRIKTIDLLVEMIAAAFPTVTLFRLTLGAADKLERICRDLEGRWALLPNTGPADIRSAIAKSPGILKKAQEIKIYVPALFLSPWFQNEMRGISAGTDRAKRATELSLQSREKVGAPPYWLESSNDGQMVCLAPEWSDYLRANIGILEPFVKHGLCRFLHTKNPGVPSITEKLDLPRARNLKRARSIWQQVLESGEDVREGIKIQDIYAKAAIGPVFSIDHFLPWSFVAHDHIWNLLPVSPLTNSAKGDSFPSVEKYLPSLAQLHWLALRFCSKNPVEQIEYSSAFRTDFSTLVKEDSVTLLQRYRDLVTPQIQIARNYGFRCDWSI